EGAGRRVIVKYGEQEKIEQEYRHFKEYVEPFIGGGRSTTVLALRRTPHLGGIAYSFSEGLKETESIQTFEEFYREADVPQIRSVLDDLFLVITGAWYSHPGKLQALDLSSDYQQHLGLTQENLERTLAHFKLAQDREQLSFEALGAAYSFTNPFQAMFEQHLLRPTYVCMTHGDLNEHNILVSGSGETRIIDFARTGPGHILRDIAALDTIVRLQLLAPEEATLIERLRMEEALCSVERFSGIEESVKGFLDSTNNQALIKAFSTAVHLRSLARHLVRGNPSDDISELYIALFYYAVNTLRLTSLDTLQREHALLSASLLNEAIQGVFHKRYTEMEIESLRLKLRHRGHFRLLSIASHQLKTPLGNIKAILEDMLAGQQGSINDRQQRRLELALDSVKREFRMIDRLLNLTRLESGKEKAELTPCNLLDCLRGAIDDNRSALQRKGLKLVEDVPQQGVRIAGDATLLTGAFSNVLENAIKFTDRGEVRIRCRLDNDWVQVEISDTGIGISSDVLPFIFDDSFQADSGLARQFEGLGAGLFLTRGWLKMHGGTIEAQSEIGRGTTFLVRLPVHHSPQLIETYEDLYSNN
ncbi:MAG TPA: ATP-binding protein, partial [Pyrinomonadaceae bacterium]